MRVRFNTKRQKDPARDQGVKVAYPPAKRRAPKWRWYMILLIVSSPLIFFLFKVVSSHVIVTAQGMITLEKIAINSSSTGYIDQIHVRVGDTIDPGQVMVRLGSPALDERERVLQAELNQMGTFLPPTDLQTENLLQNRVNLAQKNVNYQKERLGNIRFLFDQGAATIAELNQAEAAHDRSQFTLNQAQGELTSHLERTRREKWQPELQFSNRRLLIEAELEAIDAQRKRLEQRSPFLGRILDMHVDTGQTVSPGSPLLVIGKLNKPYVIAYLDPKYAKYALTGHNATVRLPDGKTFRAQVRENASLAQRLPSNLSSPIANRELMILVKLDLQMAVSETETIDGLPITVRFDFAT